MRLLGSPALRCSRNCVLVPMLLCLSLCVILHGQDTSHASGAKKLVLTRGDLAIGNLSSQISSLKSLIGPKPRTAPIETRRRLFGLLITQIQFTGSYREFATLKSLVVEDSTDSEEKVLYARYLSAIHEFDTSSNVLATVDRNTGAGEDAAREELVNRIATRVELESVRQQLTEKLGRTRDYGTTVLLAAVEADLGNFTEADRRYDEAIELYGDTSPFPIAALYFQRGLMWGEKAADSVKAREFYEKAVHYLPQYVTAQVHLAELNVEADAVDTAIAALRTVVQSDDPEPKGFLGEILTAASLPDEGLITQASVDYSNLLTAYPLAFADHGSEFFTGPGGDPQRGSELAQLNLKNRRTERAYSIAIEAAATAGQNELLCSLLSEALNLNPRYTTLKQLLEEKRGSCL